MDMVQNNLCRLELLMNECSLDSADKVQVFLNDQNLGSDSHLSEGVFPDLVTFGQHIENRAVKVAFLALSVVFDTLIDLFRVSKTDLADTLAL